MQRRKFLKSMGGACLALPLFLPGLSRALVHESHEVPPLEEVALSLCGVCPNHCSLRVRKVGDQAVSISGNPFHPVNRGHICARGTALLEELHHPDRILQPLKRSGERGSGKFEPISWDDALAEIASNLNEVRERGAEKLGILRRDAHNSLGRLTSRFLQAIGSPNDLTLDLGYPANPAIRLMQGVAEPEGYDIENSNFVLCFGTDLLGSGPAPVHFNGAYSRFRRGRPATRGRWVQIEPQLTQTGRKADQWIPIKPGTEGALALGIAYILIKRGLYDADFIRRQTFGFEDWRDKKGRSHLGFKSLILRDYTVYRVSKITGIPVTVIDQLAHDFATRKPSVAIPTGNFGETTSSTYTKMAIHALNALAGAIDRPGGVLIQRSLPYTELPEPKLDNAALRGLEQPRVDGPHNPLAANTPNRLPENLFLGKPYRLDMLIVMGGNPFHNFPEAEKMKESLKYLPHFICMTNLPDETSAWADIILPMTTFLEEWGDGITPPGAAFRRTLGLSKPSTEPAGKAQSAGDVILALAKRLGGGIAEAFPWKDYRGYLRESLAGVYRSGNGYITNGTFDASWLKTLQNMGWKDTGYDNFNQFWKQLETNGGWWDPVYSHGRWREVFQTPSGKFEFYSQTLEQAKEYLTQASTRIEPQAENFCLPHYEEARFEGEEAVFPYVLMVHETQHRRGDTGAALSTMQEMPNALHQDVWGTKVEISRETAQKLKLKDNDIVWVESPRGRIKLPVRIYSGASGEAVSIALGGGHTELGRWAKGVGVNPNALRPFAPDPITGSAALTCTRVKIYPV